MSHQALTRSSTAATNNNNNLHFKCGENRRVEEEEAGRGYFMHMYDARLQTFCYFYWKMEKSVEEAENA